MDQSEATSHKFTAQNLVTVAGLLGLVACASENPAGTTKDVAKAEDTFVVQQAATTAWTYVSDFSHRMHRLQLWSSKNIFNGSCNNTRCITGQRGYSCFDGVNGCNRRDMFLSRMYIQDGATMPIDDTGSNYDSLPDAETLVLVMPGQQSVNGDKNYNTGMKDDDWKNSWDSNTTCSYTKSWRGNSMLGRMIANYKTLFGPNERVAFVVYGDTNKYCPCVGDCSSSINTGKRNAIACHLLSYGSPGVTKRIIISGGSAGGITGLGVAHRIRSAYPTWSNVPMYVMGHEAMGCQDNNEGDFWQNPGTTYTNPLASNQWVDSVPIDTKITSYPGSYVYQSLSGAAWTVISRHGVGLPEPALGWSCGTSATCRTQAYSYSWYVAGHDEVSGKSSGFVDGGVADAALDWLYWKTSTESASCASVPSWYIGANDGCDCPANGNRSCDPDCNGASGSTNWCGCQYCY